MIQLRASVYEREYLFLPEVLYIIGVFLCILFYAFFALSAEAGERMGFDSHYAEEEQHSGHQYTNNVISKPGSNSYVPNGVGCINGCIGPIVTIAAES